MEVHTFGEQKHLQSINYHKSLHRGWLDVRQQQSNVGIITYFLVIMSRKYEGDCFDHNALIQPNTNTNMFALQG